jgi:hypothetical protein
MPVSRERPLHQLNELRQAHLLTTIESAGRRNGGDVRSGHEGLSAGLPMISSVGVGRTAGEVCNLIVNGEEALRLTG